MEKSKANDHKPDTPNTGLLDYYHRRGQVCEILTVVLPAGAVLLGVLNYGLKWLLVLAVILLVSALVPLYFAVLFASKAAEEAQEIAVKTIYAMTEQRIRTLQIVEAPEDALEALWRIRKDLSLAERNYELTEKELIGRLVQLLGSERTDEIRGIVLKYTKVGEKDRIGNPVTKLSEAIPENGAKTRVAASTF